MIKGILIAITGASAQFLQPEQIVEVPQVTDGNVTKVLNLALINDLHYDPNYTEAQAAYKASKSAHFILVDTYNAAKQTRPEFADTIASGMKTAIEMYSAFTSQVAATGDDSVRDLKAAWSMWEEDVREQSRKIDGTDQLLLDFYDVFNKIFASKYEYLFPYELCDWIERAAPKDGPHYTNLY